MKRKNIPLRVLSYNIHKGFSSKLDFNLEEIRDSIRSTSANVVCLQEIVGENHRHRSKISNWPQETQLEYLADKIWPHYSYGKNAVYASGHHGNAIMSQYNVLKHEHLNISTNRFEQRGLLYAQLLLEFGKQSPLTLNLVCVHLDLLERGRLKQIKKIIHFIQHLPHPEHPLILCGDFNDWNGRIGSILEKELNLKEAYYEIHGTLAKTFPVRNPFLSLDRIYFKNLKVRRAKCYVENEWKLRSDHAALCADFIY